jgi:hypothetical protein
MPRSLPRIAAPCARRNDAGPRRNRNEVPACRLSRGQEKRRIQIKIEVDQQCAVLGATGDAVGDDGKPSHVQVVLGLSNGTASGDGPANA